MPVLSERKRMPRTRGRQVPTHMIDEDDGLIYVSLTYLPTAVLDRLATLPRNGIKTRTYPKYQHVRHSECAQFVEIDRAIAATEQAVRETDDPSCRAKLGRLRAEKQDLESREGPKAKGKSKSLRPLALAGAYRQHDETSRKAPRTAFSVTGGVSQ